MRNLLVIGTVAVLAGGLLLGTGCNKKKKDGGSDAFNCEAVQAKNKKCAGELADAFVKTMAEKFKGKLPASALDNMKKKMKEQFESDKDLERCKKGFESKKEKDVKMKAALKKCFAKSACSDYAACFAEAVGKMK